MKASNTTQLGHTSPLYLVFMILQSVERLALTEEFLILCLRYLIKDSHNQNTLLFEKLKWSYNI